MTTTNMRIVVRRDDVAKWALVEDDLKLLKGEIGYESDTNRMKVGDGVTYWRDRPHIAGGITEVKEGGGLDMTELGVLSLDSENVIGPIGDDVTVKEYVDSVVGDYNGEADAMTYVDKELALKADLAGATFTGPIVAVAGQHVIPAFYEGTDDFPSAADAHGAVLHSHVDGCMFFAHAGAYHQLLDVNTGHTKLEIANALALKADLAGAAFTGPIGTTGTLQVNGAAGVGGTLNVTGPTGFASTVNVAGAANFQSVVQTANLLSNEDVAATRNLSAGADLLVADNGNFGGGLEVKEQILARSARLNDNPLGPNDPNVIPFVPVNDEDVVTKVYADTKLPLAGGTISGDLEVTGTVTSSGFIGNIPHVNAANPNSPDLLLDRGNSKFFGDVEGGTISGTHMGDLYGNVYGTIILGSRQIVFGDTGQVVPSNLHVLNAAQVDGTLIVDGATNFNGTVVMQAAAGFKSTAQFESAVGVLSSFEVTGFTNLTDVAASGAASVGGTLQVTDAASVGGTLQVTGTVGLDSDLIVADDGNFGGGVEVAEQVLARSARLNDNPAGPSDGTEIPFMAVEQSDVVTRAYLETITGPINAKADVNATEIDNLEVSVEEPGANKGRFFAALFTPSGGGNPPFYMDDNSANAGGVAVGEVYLKSSTTLDDAVLAVRLS